MTEETKEEKKEKSTKLNARVEQLELIVKELQEQLVKLGKGFGRNLKLEHTLGD